MTGQNSQKNRPTPCEPIAGPGTSDTASTVHIRTASVTQFQWMSTQKGQKETPSLQGGSRTTTLERVLGCVLGKKEILWQ